MRLITTVAISSAAGVIANQQRTCSANDGSCGTSASQCSLYLAPSTLPHSGLGLFSGLAIPVDESINEYTSRSPADDHAPQRDEGTDAATSWSDMFIPLGDPHYKALPHRGQQRFPSWLRYIWPEKPESLATLEDTFLFSFPAVPAHLWDFDQGLNHADGLEFYLDDLNDELFERYPDWESTERASAFVPGLASLANHHRTAEASSSGGPNDGPGLANMDRMYDKSRSDYGGYEAPWHAGAGAFTPHHGVEFKATRDVMEGMELLIDYGDQWQEENDYKLKHIARKEQENKVDSNDGSNNSDYRPKRGFVEGIHKKWDDVVEENHFEIPYELPTEKAKREGLAEGKARDSSEFEEGYNPYSEYRTNDHHLWPEERGEWRGNEVRHEENPYPANDETIVRSIDWLGMNGVCLTNGKLRVGNSPIENAGRGVFAAQPISEGSVVLTSPLIVMRQEDFTMYKTDPKQKINRNIVDKSTVIGTELLMNYAYTHPDSPVYLVPSAPLVNFVNHGTSSKKKKKKKKKTPPTANVELSWPKEGSNSANLFEWAYNQKHGSHYDMNFETYDFGSNPNGWLKDHAIDVMERSGKLAFEYVALRNINDGEEILIDYGPLWEEAWSDYARLNPYGRAGYFRCALGVPDGFFPKKWMKVGDTYEIAEIQDLANKPLKPGEVLPMTWAHNGKPLGSKYAYVVGLEKGFSHRFLKYSEEIGVIELYRRLLSEQEGYHLESDAFSVFTPGTFMNTTTAEDKLMEIFAHRYKSDKYRFNMHFVAAWEERARKDMLKALGDAGFDMAVKGFGERFGYDNMTCFHSSYMGMTHCDRSLMHSDIYATDDKSWNIVFPLITIDGSEPELDVMSEDMNTIVGVNYLKDVAYAMGDFGFHKTRMVAYYDPDDDRLNNADLTDPSVLPMRVVFGAYCSQIDETNVAMIRHIYDGDDPAPFADQFKDFPMREIHWDSSGASTLANPGGKGL
eukprot:CAMPEP_0181108662 /NCGR_PEP_ID=MMETSP1071-20121207/17750_1 /TAXON_ID=35127 /ORGANISM="Thalassiosira sp., Strain NH16" /LENGTH=966 /DNA_ID=CAMNT_0023192281 /DNA_START=91 /DNA_END=2991 /DNA_ORIENTATION=-